MEGKHIEVHKNIHHGLATVVWDSMNERYALPGGDYTKSLLWATVICQLMDAAIRRIELINHNLDRV